MSSLSGFDSEAVGFESDSKSSGTSKAETTSQTEFHESAAVATQSSVSEARGTSVCPEDLEARGDEKKGNYCINKLNEFLRRVSPAMMEQLGLNDSEVPTDEDSEDEDTITLKAKLLQKIKVNSDSSKVEAIMKSSGDAGPFCVLAITWSSAGNSIAVSLGWRNHKEWCQHDGIIKVYTIKMADTERFHHLLDIGEKGCVTNVKYNPSVAALLAYSTVSGQIAVVNMRDYSTASRSEFVLTSPQDFHDSHPISCLKWADPSLANSFLTMNIELNGKRRAATDQVLISGGSDGSVNVWQVNVENQVFQNIICYQLGASKKSPRHDISCFDFIRVSPLRPAGDKISDDHFVVGTTTGNIVMCKFREYENIADSTAVDPVRQVAKVTEYNIVDVKFSTQHSNFFSVISNDCDWTVFDVENIMSAVISTHLHGAIHGRISCVSWIPNYPRLVFAGLYPCTCDQCRGLMNIFEVNRYCIELKGVDKPEDYKQLFATAIAVCPTGSCMVALGDSKATLRIWEIPLRRLPCHPDNLEL